MKQLLYLLLTITLFTCSLNAQEDTAKSKDPFNSSSFSGLKFRSIGPAFTSGRIADFAVNPKNHSEYYVAVASGHIWKTTNSGTTFEPVFDNYGAYSIGCVVIDPNNSNVVWTGTGENNHQRALGYGDGVYKSIDGGKSWKNMGLKESRQIGGIVIDPRNSQTVFVAAEGSVWGPGGERGLYKSVDGGKTWKKVLNISEHTGVNNVVYDPRNPDIMYATSEQRRRHVFTKIGGGPETAVYKSIDAGETWEKSESGLPTVDKGGMGLAISPVNPDYLYLIVEAAEDKGGFFRSTNQGATWEKMSDHTAQGQYYNEIFCDPVDLNKVYSVETVSHVTVDGGKTWKALGLDARHVDDHAMWIDPSDNKHFLIGGDGGVYESFDEGHTYVFKSNLPVTQFYRVNVDNDFPFYNVYGGTQDNNSFGGPSRTLSSDGIVNSDWYVTNGGDGFWTAIDPENPDIVYAEAQYGNMVRYDKKSGEAIDIRPEPRKGEKTYKWNWNAPLFISPHSNTRLYSAANKVFRTDDRGDSWEVISEDLTTQIDRNTWPVMGKYWSADAVAKDVSTSQFGTIVSMAESPLKENLLFVGTDDGLIQISEDAKTWTKISKFPGVPEYTYVSDILPSKYDENIVFASFDNILRDDFKPYILKSTDKGKSWKSISGNLPVNGAVHTIEQDFVNPDLLFVGTEFGVFFTVDGGQKWIQLKSGIPVISVRDMVIQKRENDLVLATFGRGFYILDNYAPLREINKDFFNKEAHIFPVKDVLMYIPKSGRYGQGATYFKAPNPEFGAVFTYYLKEVPKTLKALRQEKEQELFKAGKPIPQPDYDTIRKENKEIDPYLIFTITDEAGNIVRRLTSSASKGINRMVWDLRYGSTSPVALTDNKFNPVAKHGTGMLALPGKYNVSAALVSNETMKELAGPVSFKADVIKNTTLPANREELVAFQKKSAELYRAIQGSVRYTDDLVNRVNYIRQALSNTPQINPEVVKRADQTAAELEDIMFTFGGQPAKASAEEVPPQHVPINDRLNVLIWTHWRSTSNVTLNLKRNYEILLEEFPPLLERIKKISTVDIPYIENEMEKAGAPWTPGRIPVLQVH